MTDYQFVKENEQRTPTKDDPLGDGGKTTYKGRTLLLGQENNELARDNFWRAFRDYQHASHNEPMGGYDRDDKKTWDIAWAAAIAANDYVFSGRTEPR